MSLISNAYMQALLKTVYENGVYNAKFQNSPILSDIKKTSWGGGKEVKYAAQYANGGNFGSNYATLIGNMDTGARNVEWTAQQGYATGIFNINQPEILTSAEERGAYMDILSNKMSACFDGMSKMLAMYLYGGKYGVIDKAAATISSVTSTGNELTLTSAGIVKMSVGTRFVVAHDATATVPGSALIDAVFTVTKIDGNVITFSSSATGVAITTGDYIELYTARTGTTVYGFDGLNDFIPDVGDRTGTAWDTYIATAFRGVDRSVAVDSLAGQFVKAATTGDTKYTDALVTLLKKTKRGGGLNDIIIVNDDDWDLIGAELNIQRNLWQATNGGAEKQGATAGFNKMSTAFGDAFIDRVVIDPFCTYGKSYMLQKDDLEFKDLGNVSKVIQPVANGQLGKASIEGVGSQGFGSTVNSQLNVDKLFNIVPGAAGVTGPEFTISANTYGNFMLKKTASTGVASLHD